MSAWLKAPGSRFPGLLPVRCSDMLCSKLNLNSVSTPRLPHELRLLAGVQQRRGSQILHERAAMVSASFFPGSRLTALGS